MAVQDQVRLGPTPEEQAMDDRGWVELVHEPEIDAVELPASGWPAGPTMKVLSISERTGALTGILFGQQIAHAYTSATLGG